MKTNIVQEALHDIDDEKDEKGDWYVNRPEGYKLDGLHRSSNIRIPSLNILEV